MPFPDIQLVSPDPPDPPVPCPQPPPLQILTQTSAMPGSSYSLPARTTCPGAVLAPSSVCASCYADGRKRYRWKGVKDAQARRLAWTLDTLENGTFIPAIVGHILARADRYFRLHDSGDFFRPDYVDAWTEIARRLTGVLFWAPTRSWARGGLPRRHGDLLLASLHRLAALPNVTVRPSALLINEAPPVLPGFAAGSTVTTNRAAVTCPKAFQTPARCGDCRRCWDEPQLPVIYLKH